MYPKKGKGKSKMIGSCYLQSVNSLTENVFYFLTCENLSLALSEFQHHFVVAICFLVLVTYCVEVGFVLYSFIATFA